ncbi:hypothetical protein RUND412_000023 [Rhizina undulata]
MIAFLIFLLSTFVHAAPLAINSTAIQLLWVPAPPGRGTTDILLTCFLTLVICVWTALHLNTDPRPFLWSRLFKTLQFIVSGIFWPEWVLLVASKQWILARDLRQRIRAHQLGDEKTFYAIMGGFVCKPNTGNSESEKHTDPEQNTLTPESFLEILRKNLLSVGTMKKLHDVMALSKADLLAKVLASVQASWFVKPQHVTHRIFIDGYVDKTVLEGTQEQENAGSSSSVVKRPASWTALSDESKISLLKKNGDSLNGEQYDNNVQISNSQTFSTTESGTYISLEYALKFTREESTPFFSELQMVKKQPPLPQTELWDHFKSNNLRFITRATNSRGYDGNLVFVFYGVFTLYMARFT